MNDINPGVVMLIGLAGGFAGLIVGFSFGGGAGAMIGAAVGVVGCQAVYIFAKSE